MYIPKWNKLFRTSNIFIQTITNLTSFRSWVSSELRNQTAQPSTAKQTVKQSIPPRVLIDQNDIFINILTAISDTPYVGKILIIYLTSLAKYNIAVQHDISKMVIVDLVRRKQFDTLQQLIKFSLINESKPLACFLLSLSNVHSSVTQMALDMLHKLKADSVRVRSHILSYRIEIRINPIVFHI